MGAKSSARRGVNGAMDDDLNHELTDKQLAAARLLATDPKSTKQDVAEALAIGRRTIFRWV